MRDYISDKEAAGQKERSAVSDFTDPCNYDHAFLSFRRGQIPGSHNALNDYICRLRIIF